MKTIRGYAAYSDAGVVRPVNEDAYLAQPEHMLFGVADGYGGNGIGNAAAKLCLDEVSYFIKNGLGDSEVTLPFVYRSYYSGMSNLIFNAFLYANQKLFHENKKHHINGRGGASVLLTFAQGNKMVIASVGLCQGFLVRRGRVQPLLRPRSYNSLRGTFQGSWNPKWAFPLMAMGHAADIEPEIMEIQMERNDLIVLATDGVYPQLVEEDFAEVYRSLVKNPSLDLGVAQQNRRFSELANQKGNQDNQAVITLVCG